MDRLEEPRPRRRHPSAHRPAYVDRGDAHGFVLLAMDTTPNYTDTFAPTAPAKWTYRSIYRVADTRVGQWSNEVSINVAP